MISDVNVYVPNYGSPLSTPLRQWLHNQDDLLVSIVSSETTTESMGLERLAGMVSDNPALIRKPSQARVALVGLLVAHGIPAGDVLSRLPKEFNRPPPAGVHELAELLLPVALQSPDENPQDSPPVDLVSACLIANAPRLLDAVLSSGFCQPRTINKLPWLHHAAITGKNQCLEVLLRHGVDPHEIDHEGNTALHNASTPEVVRLLLDAGVDAALNNHATQSPAQAWSQRTTDRSRVETLLSVLLSSPSSSPDPAESFFALAQSNNMGRLKTFARKLAVDYSIRHAGQGLVFHAALRLAHEAMGNLGNYAVPQETRVASNWLGFLIEDEKAVAATTPIERQAVVAITDALDLSHRPLVNFRAPPTQEPGHLRHLVLSLADSQPPKKHPTLPSHVREPVMKLFVEAIGQALDANDERSVHDAVKMAAFAFNTAASPYLHKHLASRLSSHLAIPPEDYDALMLAACKSLHESTCRTSTADADGFASLTQMVYAATGPLEKTSHYIDRWANSILTPEKKLALEPLAAFVRARNMGIATHEVPSGTSKPKRRF